MPLNFPNNPTNGDVYAPPGGPIYRYDAPVWNVIGSVPEEEDDATLTGGNITIGPTAPSSPAVNDVWIDTT